MKQTSGARRRGPRGDLSAEAVLTAAASVLQRDGLPSFSLRGVARELDVAPNALYTYAPSRDALLERIVDAALQRFDLTILRGSDDRPRIRVVNFACHALAQLRAHPAIARALFDRPIGGPGAYRLNESLIETLHECGPSVPVAARIAHALTAFVFGYAIIEVTDDERTVWPEQPDPEMHPLTHAAAVPVPEIDDVFRWSVHSLLVGSGC